MTEADMIEQEIIQRIRAAHLRLRFDKVVLRLVGGLKAALANVIPEGQAVIFTVTAPLKHPAKTALVLENLVRDGLSDGERREVIHDNQVRLRRLRGVAMHRPKGARFRT
ncbi:hypothetical protein SAMN02745126_05016 [Enhydrobacter aerosaccus]|uniref:Uncharacterized protein n=1 Tax=Enhydrobacter aerosaccus TaxID=225324 RepID=A0A1T4SRF1_9HYPH|nr:hypothetical protein [Enhydrobacter aerosaccus]SKA30743.1 hypothetical protein SAMN02745126_05016 [Enhydrobacter aerosaccus]